MIKLLFASLVLTFSAQAGDLENTILLRLLENGKWPVKNHCELGPGKTIPLNTFFAAYTKWTFSSKNLDQKNFSCTKIEKQDSQYSCSFNYGENEIKGTHPGWSMHLEFKYKSKRGIQWNTLQCVAVP